MKNILTIFTLFLLLQSLWSCKKDENKPDNSFNLDQLYQTGWKGNLIIYNKGETKEHKIRIVFSQKEFGSFEINSAEDGGLQYRIEGKSLHIFSTASGNAPTALYAYYLLLDGANKEKISLKSNIYSENYYQILELQRIY